MLIEDFPFNEVIENSENSTKLIVNTLKNIDKLGRKMRKKSDVLTKIETINKIFEYYIDMGLIIDKKNIKTFVSHKNLSVFLVAKYENIKAKRHASIGVKVIHTRSWPIIQERQ